MKTRIIRSEGYDPVKKQYNYYVNEIPEITKEDIAAVISGNYGDRTEEEVETIKKAIKEEIMRRHTWTASQETHRDGRQEYINRFKRTLVGQCTEARRGEHINIFDLICVVDLELEKRGYDHLNDTEQMQVIFLLQGCDFTNGTDTFEYYK